MKTPPQKLLTELASRFNDLGVPHELLTNEQLGMIACGKILVVVHDCTSTPCPDCGKKHLDLFLFARTKKPLGELFKK